MAYECSTYTFSFLRTPNQSLARDFVELNLGARLDLGTARLSRVPDQYEWRPVVRMRIGSVRVGFERIQALCIRRPECYRRTASLRGSARLVLALEQGKLRQAQCLALWY